MASTFPTSLDTIPDAPVAPALGGSTPTHAEMHDMLRDAIAAVETRIGETDSVDTTSLTYRLSAAGEGSAINSMTAKATPVDADLFPLADSAASWIKKKLSWANLKATVLSAVFGAGYTRTVFHTAKPWILPSAGTLNAGAAGAATITGMTTALPRTYTGPGKIYVPAVGSWGGGWMDFLSATITTVTLADAVATGGAYSMAALAGVDIKGPSYTLSGGEMGPNGLLEHDFLINTNNSAGAKTFKILAGATSIGGGAGNYTTSVSARALWYTAAAGAQNKQTFMNNTGLTVYGTVALQILGLAAVDFSVDQTISATLRVAVANDILILERITERLTYGA